jgi:hypothetical protein
LELNKIMSHTETPLVANLTQKQFAEFCCEIWDNPVYKDWAGSHENLWVGIAKKELMRTFNEGWQFCRSELKISPEGRTWGYETTSGTLLTVEQAVMEYGSQLPEPIFHIEIPPHRADGRHAAILDRVLKGSIYFDWYSLYYSVEGTPAFAEARRRSMKIASDPGEIADALKMTEERQAKHSAKRQVIIEDDLGYDEDDDIDIDDEDLEELREKPA